MAHVEETKELVSTVGERLDYVLRFFDRHEDVEMNVPATQLFVRQLFHVLSQRAPQIALRLLFEYNSYDGVYNACLDRKDAMRDPIDLGYWLVLSDRKPKRYDPLWISVGG